MPPENFFTEFIGAPMVILANTCLEWVIVFQTYGYSFQEHSVPTVLQPLISFTFESIARERERGVIKPYVSFESMGIKLEGKFFF